MIGLAALVTAGLTLVSGFGLGTLLLPLFALFFPLEVAVAATAIVHGANNAFKIALVGRQADRSLVLTFGLPAILAALAGASALSYMSHFGELLSYSLGPRVAVITPLKLVMAGLMLAFALLELAPRLRSFKFGREHLILGGLLSGFFGGLSGHQGALRSAFLAKVGVSAQVFVGTTAVIGFLVDGTRIPRLSLLFSADWNDPPSGDRTMAPDFDRSHGCLLGRADSQTVPEQNQDVDHSDSDRGALAGDCLGVGFGCGLSCDIRGRQMATLGPLRPGACVAATQMCSRQGRYSVPMAFHGRGFIHLRDHDR